MSEHILTCNNRRSPVLLVSFAINWQQRLVCGNRSYLIHSLTEKLYLFFVLHQFVQLGESRDARLCILKQFNVSIVK